ncbi:MAG: WYL domain-containing protein, partial [Bacteroidales bacterium]|nr:WYL domain-containing protein [Bacteroidales bacterium]
MVSELIGKYIWLIQTLSAAGDQGLSLNEIADRYERRFDQPYSRRTFNNHRLAVNDVFGVEIRCDRRSNRYFIPYSEEAMDDEKSIGWLINTFTVNNLLALGKGRLSGRVSVEEVPSGQKYLTPIMQAM